MANALVITTDIGRQGAIISIGDQSGAEAISLNPTQLIDLEDWLGEFRRTGKATPLTIKQQSTRA